MKRLHEDKFKKRLSAFVTFAPAPDEVPGHECAPSQAQALPPTLSNFHQTIKEINFISLAWFPLFHGSSLVSSINSHYALTIAHS
jgi:hypothetical protein